MQTSGSELAKIHAAKEIEDYMKTLTTEFKTKSLYREYSRNPIPMAKKKFASNRVETEDKDQQKFNNEWDQRKKTNKDENEIKAELKKAANNIAKETSSHDKEVAEDDTIKSICKQKGVTICKGCGGINCLLRQELCKKHKTEKKMRPFLGKCNGTPSKFSDLSGFANQFTPAPHTNGRGRKPVQTLPTHHSPAIIVPEETKSSHIEGYDS